MNIRKELKKRRITLEEFAEDIGYKSYQGVAKAIGTLKKPKEPTLTMELIWLGYLCKRAGIRPEKL